MSQRASPFSDCFTIEAIYSADNAPLLHSAKSFFVDKGVRTEKSRYEFLQVPRSLFNFDQNLPS